MKVIFCFLILSLISVSCSSIENKNQLVKQVESEVKDSLSTYLIYYKTTKNKIQLLSHNLQNDSSFLLAEFSEKPLDIIIDKENKKLISIQNDGVFRKSIFGKDKLEKIDKISFDFSEKQFGKAWIDAKTRNIRISVNHSIYDTLCKEYAKFQKLLADSVDFLPDWGSNQIASIVEFQNGKWITIIERATRGEACETPGLEVLDRYIHIHPNATSIATEVENSVCIAKLKKGDDELIETVEILDAEKLLKRKLSKSVEGCFKINVSSKVTVLSEAVWTTAITPHFSNKIYIKQGNSGIFKMNSLVYKRFRDKNYPYVSIQTASNYILFAYDYSNEKPLVLDLNSMNSVIELNNASSAILLEY